MKARAEPPNGEIWYYWNQHLKINARDKRFEAALSRDRNKLAHNQSLLEENDRMQENPYKIETAIFDPDHVTYQSLTLAGFISALPLTCAVLHLNV
jgi:hypothetical protein